MNDKRPRVLDVGNCDPDHGSMLRLLANFNAEVVRVMFVEEAMTALGKSTYDLVLVNRLVFADSSDGLELVKRMNADAKLRETPILMISNHVDAQERSIAAGGCPSFGKADLKSQKTIALLCMYLGAPVV